MNQLIIKGQFGGLYPVSSSYGMSESVAASMFLLERITGAMLVGIGIFTLLANSLVCGSLLFRGPWFMIDLLVGLSI